MWVRLFLSIVLAAITGMAAAVPDRTPKPGDVVAVLYGRSYTFAELGPPQATIDRLRKVPSPSVQAIIGPAGLRTSAAYKFHALALQEIVGHLVPGCDLTVTDADIREFIAWWTSGVASKYAAYRAVVASHPTIEGGLIGRPLEQLTTADEEAAGVARRYVVEWKANACLYRVQGGRIEKIEHPGPNVLYYSEAGFLFPRYTYGRMTEADRKVFGAAAAAGELTFPDPRYKSAFDENDATFGTVAYYSTAEADRAMLHPFWAR